MMTAHWLWLWNEGKYHSQHFGKWFLFYGLLWHTWESIYLQASLVFSFLFVGMLKIANQQFSQYRMMKIREFWPEIYSVMLIHLPLDLGKRGKKWPQTTFALTFFGEKLVVFHCFCLFQKSIQTTHQKTKMLNRQIVLFHGSPTCGPQPTTGPWPISNYVHSPIHVSGGCWHLQPHSHEWWAHMPAAHTNEAVCVCMCTTAPHTKPFSLPPLNPTSGRATNPERLRNAGLFYPAFDNVMLV